MIKGFGGKAILRWNNLSRKSGRASGGIIRDDREDPIFLFAGSRGRDTNKST